MGCMLQCFYRTELRISFCYKGGETWKTAGIRKRRIR